MPDERTVETYRWRGSSERASVNAGLCAQALEGLTQGDPPPGEDDE